MFRTFSFKSLAFAAIGLIALPAAVALAEATAIFDWLSIKGVGSVAEAGQYYAEIGAPADFAAWKTTYFNSGTEVIAKYYNAGDLGFGRNMHCKQKANGDVACYVANHGVGAASPVNASLDAAINEELDLAAVAMVYDASEDGNPNDIKFYVYPNSGRLNEVALDSEGAKAIPQLCLPCHGGSYNEATNSVSGASFLPFDTAAFKYSNQAGYTLADQQEEFRLLNKKVKATNPASAISTLIDGWYASSGGLNTVGATENESFIIPTYDGNSSDRSVYLNTVKPFCRSCHVAQGYNLVDPAQLANARDNVFEGAAKMPHAEQTYHNLWNGFDFNPLNASLGLKTLANHQGWSFRVTKTADTNDGTCNDDCSLREAIIASNNAGTQPSIITFDVNGTFALTRNGEDNNANNGDLDILKSVIILGNDAGDTVISGNDIDRVFHILDKSQVTLQNLTIRDGLPAGAAQWGGGISIEGYLPDNNFSKTPKPKVILNAVTMRSNRAGAGAHSGGGGITNLDGEVEINRSSIGPGNTANGGGGGIANGNKMTIRNSTLSGNTAGDGGGGIENYGNGNLELVHVTIADNTAARGAGLWNISSLSSSAPLAHISNSIIGGNVAPLSADCENQTESGSSPGQIQDFSNNLFGQNNNAHGCPDDSFSTKKITGVISTVINMNLSVSANGVFFHALVNGSPAVDAIEFNAAAPLISCRTPSYDQRNKARPTDGNFNGSLGCDIGAVEGTSLGIITNVFTDGVADDGLCTLREAVIAANTSIPSGDKAGECNGGPEVIRLTANTVYTLENTPLDIHGNVTIDANGSTLLQSKADTRAFNVWDGGNLSLKNATLKGTHQLSVVIQPLVYDAAVDGVMAQPLPNGDVENENALEPNQAEAMTAPKDAWASPEVAQVRVAIESNQPDITIIFGGGGVLVLPGGTANVLNASITGFGTDGNGGGIMNYGTLNLANSTVSGNVADGSGGGVYNSGTAHLTHVTIARNTADVDKNGTGNGGGFGNSGQATLRNSLIAENTDASNAGEIHPDVSLVDGAITSGGRNVIGTDFGAVGSFIASDVRGNLLARLNPRISNLLGAPLRHLLLGGSPALERVVASLCTFDSEEGNALFQNKAAATADQAGNPRPLDYNGNGTATCDAGAVEMQPAVNLPLVFKP